VWTTRATDRFQDLGSARGVGHMSGERLRDRSGHRRTRRKMHDRVGAREGRVEEGRIEINALALLSGGCVLAVAAVLGRRPGGDRVSFALAVAASLLLTPIVWLHYLLLLLVPLAIARPRLDRAWALTVPLFFLPGMADGSVGVNLVAIALAGALVWVSVSDLPDAVGDERHAFARLANADSL